MAISITGNFDVNINGPIDSRLVATNSTARNNIVYKYPGLKVYVLEEGITYVYGTNSQWTIDSGGSNNQGGGIYGGSGSLPDDIGVYMGSVGTSLDDKSNELYHWSDTPSGDNGYLYNYFYRRANGNDYDTISYTTEYKLSPDNGSLVQGPYVEYNGLDNNLTTSIGNLVLGTPRLSGGSKGGKIVISSMDYISFDPSGGVGSFPITIANQNSTNYIGWNYNQNLPSQSYNSSSNSSSRIKLSSQTVFESRKINTTSWNELLSIDNSVLPNEVDSPIKLVVDTSAKDWDSTVTTRTTDLKTVPGVVRDLEHRFTKLQIWNQGTSDATLVNNVLILSPDGNSFNYAFANRTYIKDIKIRRSNLRGGPTSDFPNGSIITIRFTNLDPIKPGYIQILNKAETNGSNIISDFTDAVFRLSDEEKLTIVNDTATYKWSDIITFRRISGKWEIINVNRYRKLTERNWILSGDSSSDWSFTSVSYLNSLGSNRSFVSLSTTPAIYTTSKGNPYNKFPFTTSPTSTTREILNSEGFKFRISVDGNRIVFVQGNFKIRISGGASPGTQFFYKTDDVRQNIWRIGKINSISLLPQWETAWAFVSGYGWDSKNNLEITLSDMVLSIARTGDIFLQFNAEPTNAVIQRSGITPEIDVWVPPFSYTAATGSFVVSGGGGVGGV